MSFDFWGQEYEIKSEYVEIDTKSNQVVYEGDVQFSSDQISFSSSKLVVDQKQKKFIAEGNPINISYIADGQEVFGNAKELELYENILYLSNNVHQPSTKYQARKQNQKVKSNTIKIDELCFQGV